MKILKIACLLLIFVGKDMYADVKLPHLISTGMVLQRNETIKIWGWADAEEEISVNLNQQNFTTKSSKDGKWMINLPKMQAGGPYTLTVKGKNTIVINDVLIGDVWICSGQSNMELPVHRVAVAYPGLVENSLNDKIRHFGVNTVYDFNIQRTDFESGSWKKANPENVGDFTATGYFFAKALYEKYQIPIGLIRIAVGGSPAEAWLPENTIKKYPHYYSLLEKYKNKHLVDSIIIANKAKTDNWNSNIDRNDLGLTSQTKWFDNTLDFSDWSGFTVPALWKSNPFLESQEKNASKTSATVKNSGVIWFKKEFKISAQQLDNDNLLILGALVDRDEVYVNGIKVGSTGYQYPPRRYKIPKGVLKTGKNTLTVRLISNNGNGGFVPDKFYGITSGRDTLKLDGEWKYKVGYASEPMPGGQVTFHYQPTGLFNAMVSPLLNYRKKGVIWYQGESNVKNPKEYETLFGDLILAWREYFNTPKMPFVYVQLANFMEEKPLPVESGWAQLREAQRKVLEIPNTAMAVTIDIGEWNDIHPLNKADVGKRLALGAQKIAYSDKKVVYSGPVYRKHKIKGNKIEITFSHTGSGMVTRNNEKPAHFAIADASGNYKWAEAEIKKNKIVVWNNEIPNPEKLRYGWSDNPAKANLYNKEGLPASPFEIIK